MTGSAIQPGRQHPPLIPGADGGGAATFNPIARDGSGANGERCVVSSTDRARVEPFDRAAHARAGALALSLAAALGVGLPAQAGFIIGATPTEGGDLDLTQYEDFVHFVGSSPSGRARLGANGLPSGAVVAGDAFRNFADTYRNGRGAGEISRGDNAPAVRLAYAAAPPGGVAPGSRAIWFGDYGDRTGVSFDVALPSTDGVLSVFTGGFCGRGTTLSATLGGASAVAGAPSPAFCDHHAARFDVAWSGEAAGSVLQLAVNNDPLESGGALFGNTGVIGAFVQPLAPAVDAAQHLLSFAREGAAHDLFARIATTRGQVLTQRVFEDTEDRDGEAAFVARQSLDYDFVDQLFGKRGVAATTHAEVVGAVGVQRAAVAATSADPGTYDAQASLLSNWWDYLTIDGGVGTGSAQLAFDVHGVLGGGDEYMYLYLTKQDLAVAGRATPGPQFLGEFNADATSHGAGEFRERFVLDVEFEYGVPFRIDSFMELYARNGGAADFANTVEIARFLLPAGASLRSSALLHGSIDADTYAVRTAAVPAPAGVAGLAALALLLLRTVRVRRIRPA